MKIFRIDYSISQQPTVSIGLKTEKYLATKDFPHLIYFLPNFLVFLRAAATALIMA